MRVVLDTKILVSALITKGTPPDDLYQAWLRDEIEIVTSVAQLEEVIDVLARAKIRKYVNPDEAAQMVTALSLRATVLGHVPVIGGSPDPKDDSILAAAVAGDVALVVSGDKRDMLALGHVDGIPIRSARETLEICLNESADDSPWLTSGIAWKTEAPAEN